MEDFDQAFDRENGRRLIPNGTASLSARATAKQRNRIKQTANANLRISDNSENNKSSCWGGTVEAAVHCCRLLVNEAGEQAKESNANG